LDRTGHSSCEPTEHVRSKLVSRTYLSKEEQERIESSVAMDWLADEIELTIEEADVNIEEAQRFILTLGDDLAFY
jgi:hypothetical protein